MGKQNVANILLKSELADTQSGRPANLQWDYSDPTERCAAVNEQLVFGRQWNDRQPRGYNWHCLNQYKLETL
jgi:hypothetical protein